MAGEDTGRINVSRDFLKAELLGMELRLVEKLATKAEVETLALRVAALEERDPPSRAEWDVVKLWHAGFRAVLAVLSIVAVACLPMLFKHYFG